MLDIQNYNKVLKRLIDKSNALLDCKIIDDENHHEVYMLQSSYLSMITEVKVFINYLGESRGYYLNFLDDVELKINQSPYLCKSHYIGVLNLLHGIEENINNGLFQKLENKVSAVIFDDFLDAAELYLEKNMKIQSSVIVSVVFEDTIKNICRKNNLIVREKNRDRDNSLETLINALTSANVFDKPTSNLGKAAASLRNYALHSNWENIEEATVRQILLFNRNLISKYLSVKENIEKNG